MTFTVGSLLTLPSMQTVSLTPGVGEERQITWGHVCELRDPWRWVGAGALLMTTGIGVPRNSKEQRAYLDGVYEAGVSAVAVDEVMMENPFTDEALEYARDLGLPILATKHEVPFILVAMAIAEAIQQESAVRIQQTEREHGALLLTELCDGSIPADPAARLVASQGVTSPFSLAVAEPDDTHTALDVAHEGFDTTEISVLITVREGQLMMLTTPGPGTQEILELLGLKFSGIGVSAQFERLDNLPTALRQARSALIRTHHTGRVLHFEENESASLFLPNDTEQLRRIARQVLGPLSTYDAQRGTALTQTLRVFLEENRSWLRASERLFVHRQTLIARISRIEKIIGRDLSSMEDTAECWLAVQAAIGCGDLEPADPNEISP